MSCDSIPWSDPDHPGLEWVLMNTPPKIEVCENGRVYGNCRDIRCPEHQRALENLARYGMTPYEHWHIVKDAEHG